MRPDRRYSIKRVEDLDELVHLLADYTWCGCQGFEHDGHLFVNESLSPDADQQYAVLKPRENKGTRAVCDCIESITVSLCGKRRLKEIIQETLQQKVIYCQKEEIIETPQQHKCCELCCVPSGGKDP